MSSNSLKMDIENPLVLKRSSSAPMINELNNAMNTQTNSTSSREPSSINVFSSRPRRFSTSFSPLLSGPSSPKLTPRVNQLRQEESVDILGREAAHERELNSAMVMSQSYEDLTLINEPKSNDMSEVRLKMLDQLQLSNSMCPVTSVCSSPSPTRSAFPISFKGGPFLKGGHGLSPSPTRTYTTRRSQSPIAMRPSSLGPVKRKCDMEESEPPAKKLASIIIAQPKLELVRCWSESDSSIDSMSGSTSEHTPDPSPKPD